MQLDLFEDNRPGILLNLANEFILARDLDQAVSVYDQLSADYPDDRHVASLRVLVDEWCGILSGIDATTCDPAKLQAIWQRLETISHPALRSIVPGILIDALRAMPHPERIYMPPRFHLGHILLEARQFAAAADCFGAALSTKGIPRGRFLAWQGDALTLAGDRGAALKSYLAAFLDDPLTVEMSSVRSPTINALHVSMVFAAADEIEEDEELAWLPVWGWLQGVFTLPLHSDPSEQSRCVADFELLIEKESCCVPRLWFDMLTHAEMQRVVHRDDRELAAIRRLMKRANGFMFGCYLEKIGGRSIRE